VPPGTALWGTCSGDSLTRRDLESGIKYYYVNESKPQTKGKAGERVAGIRRDRQMPPDNPEK